MAHPFKREQMSLEDFNRMPTMCAWECCEETFGGDMPFDWRWLLMIYSAKHALPQRHAALCGKHARELDSLLKTIADPRL